MQTESRLVVAKAGGGVVVIGVTAYGNRVSFGGDENVLELDGDDCTTL